MNCIYGRRSAKIVGKSGFWRYVLYFSAVLPAGHAEPAGIILKVRCKFYIMGLESYNGVSTTTSARAATLIMNSNAKSQLTGENADLGEESASFADFDINDSAQYCDTIHVD